MVTEPTAGGKRSTTASPFLHTAGVTCAARPLLESLVVSNLVPRHGLPTWVGSGLG